MLFAGDLIYEGPIYVEKKGGLAKFRRSVERIMQLKDLRRIFSGHNAFEFPVERLRVLYAALTEIKSPELESEIILDGELRLVPS